MGCWGLHATNPTPNHVTALRNLLSFYSPVCPEKYGAQVDDLEQDSDVEPGGKEDDEEESYEEGRWQPKKGKVGRSGGGGGSGSGRRAAAVTKAQTAGASSSKSAAKSGNGAAANGKQRASKEKETEKRVRRHMARGACSWCSACASFVLAR